MTAPQHDLNDLNDRLMAAVASKDSDAVRACLRDGADPDAPGPDGLPVLCAAVAGFDHETADALTEGGADSDVELPDGTTPLLRAVDLGSPALVGAVLGKDPRLRLSAADRKRLLGLARHWYETGEDEELRRRTGAAGPATRRLVKDDNKYTDIEEVSLGGLTVRAGHSGVLTDLEREFGILTPVAELVARAVPYLDDLHANWSTARYILASRHDPEDWPALAGLRHHPDPVHRRFLAGVLWSRNSSGEVFDRQDAVREAELVAEWVLDEPDGEVLASVLDVYTDYGHPDEGAIGLRYADHPDPRVRREAVFCLIQRETPPSEVVVTTVLALSRDPDSGVRVAVAGYFATRGDLTPVGRETLLTLIRDPDLWVRVRAAESLSGSRDRTAAVADALAALLDEEDQLVRLEAAYALAIRDDPRTEWAYERVGPLGPDFDLDHRVHALSDYRRRNRPDGI
ncbi:ankyrin repeat domain-containing protein [Streptomyces sp. I05A-00742]|uniref:ankyrin repeat domain-containing protein n=1 Tax=Streptomyces sp. I05A-00742 TaxID=2732853 RepID=UPI002017D34B|nr:HEAT repeat domain-containing protein [Streptomyces sp. I05A-00742]